MTQELLDGLAPDDRVDLPVMALNDLAFRRSPATAQMPARIDIAHRDRPDEPLISFDPADGATFVARVSEMVAAAIAHEEAERSKSGAGRHAASVAGGDS